MSYLLLVTMLVFCFAGLLLAGCGRSALETRAAEGDDAPETSAVVVAETESLTRTELRQRLRALAAKPKPTRLLPGAMCYKPAGPPDRVEYACSVCGERTVYGKDQKTWSELWLLSRDLPACRRLVKQIKGLNVKLDESRFCRKCSPDAKDPGLVLVVTYDGVEKPHRVRDISAGDLKLLAAFMSGSKVHKGETDKETPLKEHLPRLQELLGVKLKR